MVVPRKNHLPISLPPFVVGAREQQVVVMAAGRVVAALRSQPSRSATYSQLLELLGVDGDAAGARTVRKALTCLIADEMKDTPRVSRIGRGAYQLEE
jgi:hypothetical protein